MTHIESAYLLSFINIGGPELMILMILVGFPAIVVVVVYGIVKATSKSPRSAPPPMPNSRDVRLKEIESLRAQSLITDDEYRSRRQRVLDEL